MKRISVLVPIRNEAQYIERCLHSILNQTLPAEAIEILVIDGLSTDLTPQILSRLQAEEPRIQVLENPAQTAPYAMNIGLRHATGDIWVRVDGHCEIAPDYLALCLQVLEETGAGCVGGRLNNVGETAWARAIAMGMSSPFGVGNALFRYTQTACEVDTLAFGAYRREVLEKVGLFNEALTRNQDDEYNYRVRAAGYRIWLDPRIQSTYYTRGSLPTLWKQYYQYGYWKIIVLREHPGSLQLRHLIPACFVLSLAGALLLSIFSFWGCFLLGAIGGAYCLADLYFSARQAWTQFRYFPALLLIFPTLHLAYGVGFLGALFSFLLGKKLSDYSTKLTR
ncbi:glycosyltransferase family 2 protein [bacterium (Candidatus Blackallbacteria) CG17_big_fil_post_rev_8_21_14_2_50_48_46]|uniref:Glycosyltransferase family 2 protein n=1 Tax=bacterium (Candidatus Blackallbacteria) CG17_big_fil_post_rev_8_21_14_2_50_48_46 TaxID=2014261 RepID=A0A2M7FXT6_9BACT|nr:MAG: succinoglycan biosynthesis protein exoa [bacterium (Candidatus Blackallbacteria) CG18_big_fil_WC_8_21_14_2_50_49_26]PIW14110.1 MAG: glycosyltransferase family 2 protein [bacterium (Candidatus Blackallbacteria) CG17_big_fil_post_rev_8_21_14_2_50_48_46]PIW45840.1 MAG: glycosyltransferase family 2 protein [bacterium (Candidatus Blackallbacteria) CG13_big_fil_rev_8_21_14_2_50_49_14]